MKLYRQAFIHHHLCRSPRGERGLKSLSSQGKEYPLRCRSPRGERGLKYDNTSFLPYQGLSLPTRGAWIEISRAATERRRALRRSPRGERGLKCLHRRCIRVRVESLPTRGAWIEITVTDWLNAEKCRSPRGERGLKFVAVMVRPADGGRSPRGERGLK